MTASRPEIPVVIKGVLLVLFCIVAVEVCLSLKKVNDVARYSAHAALTQEIQDRLAEVQTGSRYPESLSQLRLTYSGGGDGSLLRLFIYESKGTNCTFRTQLGSREIVRSFP